jgi:hypothetical protein
MPMMPIFHNSLYPFVFLKDPWISRSRLLCLCGPPMLTFFEKCVCFNVCVIFLKKISLYLNHVIFLYIDEIEIFFKDGAYDVNI